MADITIPGMFLSGDHASRPAATAVGSGALYSCSDHALIYQSDGSSWTTWADLTGTASSPGLVLLDTQTVTGSDGVLNFTAINQTYNDLILEGLLRDDDAAALVANGPLLQMGDGSLDTGANYDWYDQQFRDANTDADAGAEGATAIQCANTVNSAGATAGYWTSLRIEILAYLEAPFKHTMIQWYTPNSAGDNRMGVTGGLWKSTGAVDTLRISGVSAGNLKVGSKFRLYGRL